MKLFTKNIGDYLVIWVTGEVLTFIAEITQSEPLQMKVKEDGPFAYLRNGDYIIHERDTIILQGDVRHDTNAFLEGEKKAGRKVWSGLRSLGVNDDKIREILPAPVE